MCIIAIAEEFARNTILPRAAAWEKSRAMATTELREAISVGIGSLKIGVEHGGLGLDYLRVGNVLRVLASADFDFAFSIAVHSAVASLIAKSNSPVQLDQYVRRVQTGELIFPYA